MARKVSRRVLRQLQQDRQAPLREPQTEMGTQQEDNEMPTQSRTGVEVNVGFFPLGWFLFFCRPTIVIDGRAEQRSWGTHFFPLEPGRHTVKIFFRYFFMAECGANSIDVTVQQGRMSRIKYYMWPWMFAKGSIEEV